MVPFTVGVDVVFRGASAANCAASQIAAVGAVDLVRLAACSFASFRLCATLGLQQCGREAWPQCCWAGGGPSVMFLVLRPASVFLDGEPSDVVGRGACCTCWGPLHARTGSVCDPWALRKGMLCCWGFAEVCALLSGMPGAVLGIVAWVRV